MTKQELFNYYYNLMSEEYRQEIKDFENFKMNNVINSIKVNFKNRDWIRVYQKLDGTVEWY
ncbi:hypothetical protein CLOACE_20320 [Clostridium acetireducens DSM 10703]|uniref:Uncharacterized protein n=1 Tax=Clostridium acetireducens DSM 10703 TaxID=1121290 RepID=A0A1E8EWG0_9CLOT|nr:hypothetical protein [Clostridium acetireducens]OFI04961.1 hypothetical protein CLOACE_20320 [Clostridium acetireducens DSM 10703]